MFPKAHAAAYVTMAFRAAYFKTHYPLAFYAAYFSVKASHIESSLIIRGYESIKSEMSRLEQERDYNRSGTYALLEAAAEMHEKGFSFLPIDICLSESSSFTIEGNSLRCPLLTIPNLGIKAAEAILKNRKYAYTSIEDFKYKTRVTASVIKILKQHGCFKNIPVSNQLTFDFQ